MWSVSKINAFYPIDFNESNNCIITETDPNPVSTAMYTDRCRALKFLTKIFSLSLMRESLPFPPMRTSYYLQAAATRQKLSFFHFYGQKKIYNAFDTLKKNMQVVPLPYN